jgi:hypothetical protein
MRKSQGVVSQTGGVGLPSLLERTSTRGPSQQGNYSVGMDLKKPAQVRDAYQASQLALKSGKRPRQRSWNRAPLTLAALNKEDVERLTRLLHAARDCADQSRRQFIESCRAYVATL